VLVSDRLAERAIEDVLTAVDVGAAVTVVEGRELLDDLLDGQFG